MCMCDYKAPRISSILLYKDLLESIELLQIMESDGCLGGFRFMLHDPTYSCSQTVPCGF